MPVSSSSYSSIRAYCRAFIFLAKAIKSALDSNPRIRSIHSTMSLGLEPRSFLGTKLFQAGNDLGGSHWRAPSMGPGSFKRVGFRVPSRGKSW